MNTYKALSHCNTNMDVLVCLGTNAAYGYSVLSVTIACMNPSFHGHHYFETSAMLVTFIVLGRYQTINLSLFFCPLSVVCPFDCLPSSTNTPFCR